MPSTTADHTSSLADIGVPAVAVAEAFDAFERGEVASPLAAAAVSNQTIQESMRLLLMVRAYQVMGHFAANLDPLGISNRPTPAELEPEFYGFTEKDLDREYVLSLLHIVIIALVKRTIFNQPQ